VQIATLQTIVIVSSALSGAYFGLKICTGAVESAKKTRYWTTCLFCSALTFGVGGYLSVLRISHSDRPTEVGTITDLTQSGGKSPHSYFKLRTEDGRLIRLRCSYHGLQLVDDEEVSVKYLCEYGSVLDLEVLSGRHLHWILHESDDLGLARVSTYFGMACFIAAMIVWLTPLAKLPVD
jgi:hypothetical protein